jgi:hypothetical protein
MYSLKQSLADNLSPLGAQTLLTTKGRSGLFTASLHQIGANSENFSTRKPIQPVIIPLLVGGAKNKHQECSSTVLASKSRDVPRTVIEGA